MSKIEIALLATAILFVFLLALRSWYKATQRRAAAEWAKEQERRRFVDNQQRQMAQMAVQNAFLKPQSMAHHGAQIIRPERIMEFKQAASASLDEAAKTNQEWEEQQKKRRRWDEQNATDTFFPFTAYEGPSLSPVPAPSHSPTFHGGGGSSDGGGASGDWGSSSSSSDSSSSSSCSSSSSDSGSSSSSDSGSSCSSD